MRKNLTIIGSNTLITVAGVSNIPAKIDTGADSSSIWASNIKINPAKQLEFTLFGPESPLYTNETLASSDFRARKVRNSMGDEEIRYRVRLPAIIEGRKVLVGFTLADRSRNNFPVLIGRKTLKNKFLVDVSQRKITPKSIPIKDLNDELMADPEKFHQRYMD